MGPKGTTGARYGFLGQDSDFVLLPLRQSQAGPCPGPVPAFTLIELLVVVAIIALLVSILVPSLNDARELAERAACAGHLHAQGQAMTMYVDNYGFFPLAYASNEHIWYVALNEILNLPASFTCPSQGIEPWDGVTVGENDVRFSYGYNVFGAGAYANGLPRGLTHYYPGGVDWRKMGQIVRPSEMIVLTDSDTTEENPGHGIWDGLIASAYSLELNPDSYINLLLPGRLHQGSSNVLFVDGHVTWHEWSWFETNYAKWNYDGLPP